MSLYLGVRRAAHSRPFGTGERYTRVIPDNLSSLTNRKSQPSLEDPMAGLSMGALKRFSILIMLPGGPGIPFEY